MKIYVKAFLEKNFGDDLMLLELLKAFPNILFYIYYPEENEEFYQVLLKEQLNWKGTRVELYHIPAQFPTHYFSYVLLLGGSVLMGSREEGVFFRERNITALKKLKNHGTKYLIIGCNTGPFISETTEEAVKKELRHTDFVITRDQASYLYAKALIPHQLTWTKDILWDMGKKVAECARCFGLGITLFCGKNKAHSIQFWTQVLDHYIHLTQEKVCVFAFSVGKQEDHTLCRVVKNKSQFPDKIETVFHQENTPYDLINFVPACEKFIGIRFHGVVMALSCGVPVLPLRYSNKTDNMCHDLGADAYVMDLSQVENMNAENFVRDIIMKDESFFHMEGHIYKNKKPPFEILKEYLEKEEHDE